MNGHPWAIQSAWEAERHIRGQIRWHPFDNILNAASSAGSAAVIDIPSIIINTGVLAATPSSKFREHFERRSNNTSGTDQWKGALATDGGLNYWGRPHHITAFMCIGSSTLVLAGGRIYGGIYMRAPGVGPWVTNPAVPRCMLRYARNDIVDPGGIQERWELVTATGDGTAEVVTVLTGVVAPQSAVSPNGAATHRLEIFYKPGEYVEAAIDGLFGGRNTTGLPDPVTVPAASEAQTGFGIYIENGQIGDIARAQFTGMMNETYRP